MRWPPPFPAGRTMQRFQVTATDTAWTAGHGPQTQDPISAILLLSAGRRAALPQRAGDGAAELTGRLRRRAARAEPDNRHAGMRTAETAAVACVFGDRRDERYSRRSSPEKARPGDRHSSSIELPRSTPAGEHLLRRTATCGVLTSDNGTKPQAAGSISSSWGQTGFRKMSWAVLNLNQ
jgi:hypothetical protein